MYFCRNCRTGTVQSSIQGRLFESVGGRHLCSFKHFSFFLAHYSTITEPGNGHKKENKHREGILILSIATAFFGSIQQVALGKLLTTQLFANCWQSIKCHRWCYRPVIIVITFTQGNSIWSFTFVLFSNIMQAKQRNRIWKTNTVQRINVFRVKKCNDQEGLINKALK